MSIEILKAMAVGDSMGLPWEGLRPQPGKNDWQQCFLFNWGVTSDDTQHAAITVAALAQSQGDPERFRAILGRKLALWFLCLPPGIGLATLRASLKLCLGLRAPQSGVFSAGNGPAMRAPVLGWEIHEDEETLEAFTRISTETTHTDPKALIGSLAIAKTMAALRGNPDHELMVISEIWERCSSDPEWRLAIQAVLNATSAEDFQRRTNQRRGTGGYIFHTVPTALWIWKTHRADFRAAIETALRMGGDTDTCAAIVAALSAASGGTPPDEWNRVIGMPAGNPPGPAKQLFLNLVTTILILAVHIPLRVWKRLR